MGFSAPEFDECDVVDQLASASGKPSTNPLVECKHCNKQFRAGAYRIRGHPLGLNDGGVAGCLACPDNVLEKFQKLQDVSEAQAQKKRKRVEIEQLTSGSGSVTDSALGTNTQPTIVQLFKPEVTAEADAAVGRFIFAEGIPFVKTDSPYFSAMLSSVAKAGPNYRPPSREKLRTTLLDKEVAHVEKLLEVVPLL